MSLLDWLGWPHQQQLAYEATRCGNPEAHTRAQLLTRGGGFVKNVDVVSAGIKIDSNGPRCLATLANEAVNGIPLADFLTFRLAMWDVTYVPDYGWLEVPIHNGPITDANPGDAVTQVNARGCDDLVTNELREPHTFLKGHLITNALTTALHDWSGIPLDDIHLPSLRHTLHRDMAIPRGTGVRKVVEDLAESVNMTLRFRPDGKTLMRETPTVPHHTFYDAPTAAANGEVPSILEDGAPARSQTLRDSDGNYLPNWIKVQGAKGVEEEWDADPQSPISAQTLAINGVDSWHLRRFTNSHIGDPKVARALARSKAFEAEQNSQSVTVDVRTMPIFLYNDCVTVHAASFLSTFNMTQFSYGCGGDGDDERLAIGYSRRMSFAGTRVRLAR